MEKDSIAKLASNFADYLISHNPPLNIKEMEKSIQEESRLFKKFTERQDFKELVSRYLAKMIIYKKIG